jgi:hypothetical protein
MTFEEVLPLLKQGKKIRRSGWHKEFFIVILNDCVAEYSEEGYTHPELWTEDFLAEDWEVME